MHSAKPGFCAPPAERHQGREQYSTKLWRHKNEISKIMEFVRIFWKNNIQEAYLPKMSISRQIVSEILAQLCLENSIQTLLNFFWVDPEKNLKGLYGVFWV